MANESGTWIMYGVDEDDPYCLMSVGYFLSAII